MTFTESDPFAIPEMERGTFSLFPNPVNNQITISGNKIMNELKIFNIFGTLVKETGVNAREVILDVDDLSPGLYLINIHSSDNSWVSERIIKY